MGEILYCDLHEEMSKKLKENVDMLIRTEYGFYTTERLDKIAMAIVDRLANEKLNYEEALRVLRNSEDLLRTRAMVV